MRLGAEEVLGGFSNVIDSGGYQSGGLDNLCVVLTDHRVFCRGSNTRGELGDGTRTASTTFVEVMGGVSATHVAVGQQSVCAIQVDQSVRCWGTNAQGQLGIGDLMVADSPTPMIVPGLTNVVGLSVKNYTYCALRADGSVACWGDNFQGTVGNGSASTVEPAPVDLSLAGIAGVAMGQGHACAASSSGVAYCWGAGVTGELGDGLAMNSRSPVMVSGLVDAIDVAAGSQFSCALRATGEVMCWGRDGFGQQGNGPGVVDSFVPTPVNILTNAVEIGAGLDHVCVRLTTGELSCWGRNLARVVHDSTVNNYHEPITYVF
ncbi:MAG: RCC1 domain-containing protein [Sandaracinaceae bacterium]